MSTILDAWLLPPEPHVWTSLFAVRGAYLAHLDATSGTEWPADALAPKYAQLFPLALGPHQAIHQTVMRLPHWTPWDTDTLIAGLAYDVALPRLRVDTRTDPEPGDLPSDHPLVDLVDGMTRARHYWLWPLIDQDDLDRWRRT